MKGGQGFRPRHLFPVARRGSLRVHGSSEVERRVSDFAYLTTTGRRTGRPHTIEIWYAEREGTVYLLSGGMDRSDWVRNVQTTPQVRVRLGGPRDLRPDVDGEVDATARLVVDPTEDARARRLLAAKYQGWREGTPLSDWARTSLVVALDVDDGSDRPS